MAYKKIVLTVFIFTCGVLNSFAQPNGGFESWTTEFTYESPDGWQTGNFLSLLTPPNPLSAFKVIGSDTHSGFYAIKIKTIYVNNNPWPVILDDTTGAAFTGKFILSPFSYIYGFPYTGRPEKLEFWAKYFPVGNDTAEAAVILQKWNGIGHDTIAGGRINISSVGIYTHFQLNLSYLSNAIPDTAAIIFMSSKNHNCSRVNSTLFIDDVAYTGWVGVEERKKYADKVKVFPNPAKGDLNIQTQIEEAEKINILNSSGSLLAVCKIKNNNASVNTSLFAAGVYFYEILDKKKQTLTKGSFSVVK